MNRSDLKLTWDQTVPCYSLISYYNEHLLPGIYSLKNQSQHEMLTYTIPKQKQAKYQSE